MTNDDELQRAERDPIAAIDAARPNRLTVERARAIREAERRLVALEREEAKL